MTARTRCGLVKLRECSELLHGSRFPQKLKGAVKKSYVRPAIQYGSEAWCLKESEMGIIPRTERSNVCNVWSTAQRKKKIYRFDVDAGFE